MNNTFNIGSTANVVKPIIFKLTHKNEDPATEGRYYPGVQRVPSEDVIYDPVTKKSTPIRYSVNEESIFKSKQPSHVELTDIIFTNGSLRVFEDRPNLLEYLRLCNWNKGNKDRLKGKSHIFYEYNPEVVAAEMIENETLEVDARYKAQHMDFDELMPLARAIKMNVNRSAKEIRHDMMQFAKLKPRAFMESLDNPTLKRRAEVLEAVDLGIIRIDQRAVFLLETLGDTNIHIVSVGQDPTDSFVDFTLTEKEGEEVFKTVMKKRKKILG